MPAFSSAFSSAFDTGPSVPSGPSGPFVYDEIGMGGISVGGRVEFYSAMQGGVAVDGSAGLWARLQDRWGRMLGGVVVGGQALLIGGLEWSGTADQTENYGPPSISGGVKTSGSGTMGYHYPLFTPAGGPVTGGSSRSRLHCRYVVTGAVLVGGTPSEVQGTHGFDLTFLWRVNSAIAADISFKWNAGDLPVYWYRVVGKARDTSTCPPIQTEVCCKQFTANVPAKSIADLCSKLKAMRWKWPIATVERWSRPAQNSLVSDDDQCNILEPVQICKNIACLDVCVDYDQTQNMGFSMTASLQKVFTYYPEGSVQMFGDASYSMEIYRPAYQFVPEGGPQILAEEAYVDCPYLGFWPEDVPVEVGGEADLSAEYWRFVAGEWPLMTEANFPTVVDTNWDGTHAAWENPGGFLNEGSLATCELSATTSRFSNFVIVRGFGLDVPADATITGLEVGITRKVTKGCRDHLVCLTWGPDITSDNMAKDIYWPIDYGTGNGVETFYGGHGVEWRNDEGGYSPLTPQEVNDPEFGIGLQVWGSSTLLDNIASVDCVRVRVYYETAVGQVVRISGTAPYRATDYMHIVEGAARISGNASVRRITGTVRDIGMGVSGMSAVRVSGASALSYSFLPTGGPVVAGMSPSQHATGVGSPAITIMHMSGGAEMYGAAKIFPYWEIAQGGLQVGTKSVLLRGVYRFVAAGGPIVSGEVPILSTVLSHHPSGSIQINGEAECSSTAWRYVSDGNPPIFVTGEVYVNLHELSTMVVETGFDMEVYDLRVVRPVEAATDTLSTITGVVKRCGCNVLPYQLLLKHNLVQNNRFAQFLVRNRRTYPNGFSLFYSDKLDSWQCNEHYRGLAIDGRTAETWSLVYEFKCSSKVAATDLGDKLWQFSMQVVQKNLVTMRRSDTKLNVYFIPGDLCASTGALSLTIYYDTVLKTGYLKPTATIYDTVLYDEIGLFKTPQWFKEPEFQVQISQRALRYDDPTYHIDPVSTVSTGPVAPALVPPITLTQRS